VVAGTHGKTTTACLLAFILDRGGLDPSFLVGGLAVDFGRSYRVGAGEHFVIEGDEYDSAFFDKRPKFVHYLPDIAIVGNVEFDHADIYRDLDAVRTAFLRFLDVIPRRGLLLAGTESPVVQQIARKARCPVETFGLHEEADWRAVEIRPEGDATHFRLQRRGEDAGECVLALSGEHNVRNALAALAAAGAAGLETGAACGMLERFRGVRRRLETRGRIRGITVYDDFAHHPTAVRATLGALRERGAGEGRLVAVFEPRSYTSRTSHFQEQYAQALALADRAIVAAAYLPEKVPEGERLSEANLVASIAALGREAAFVPTAEGIVTELARSLRAGDRVVVLSNGGFGGIHDRILGALAERTDD
jgi:UDP-N-acetylmuramate: L-alanyl-gamma-D-glutamyl-meso-diaminopimelate ligase